MDCQQNCQQTQRLRYVRIVIGSMQILVGNSVKCGLLTCKMSPKTSESYLRSQPKAGE